MLVIRQKQLDSFLMGDEDKFVRFVAEHIRENHPQRVSECPENLLEQMVRFGLQRARSYGFERAEDLTAFVAVMFDIAPNFEEQSKIKESLEDNKIPTNDKFDWLWNRTTDEDWEEAKKNCKAELWFTEETQEVKEFIPKLRQNYANENGG